MSKKINDDRDKYIDEIVELVNKMPLNTEADQLKFATFLVNQRFSKVPIEEESKEPEVKEQDLSQSISELDLSKDKAK